MAYVTTGAKRERKKRDPKPKRRGRGPLMKNIGKPKAKKLFKVMGKYMKAKMSPMLKLKKQSKMAKAAAYKAKNRGKQGYREDRQKYDMGQTSTGKYYAKQGRKYKMKRALGYTRRKPSSGGTRPSSSGGAYREIIGMISGGGGR